MILFTQITAKSTELRGFRLLRPNLYHCLRGRNAPYWIFFEIVKACTI